MPPISAVSPSSWRGLIRSGLAQLAAGEGAITRLALPEPLRPDAVRLQRAQAEFQRLVALTATLITYTHFTSSAAAAATATAKAQTAIFKKRMGAVLASPDVCIADLSSEISLAAALPPDQEPAVNAALRNMLGKSSSALRSMGSGLCTALTLLLLLPSSPSSSSPARPSPGTTTTTTSTSTTNSDDPEVLGVVDGVLKRCGAGALGDEVGALAAQLRQVAAVTEAVCEPWYVVLCTETT